MIFNPLFINDNSTSQLLTTKAGKLSNKKYLFSDIVKIVMNPVNENSKISNLQLQGIDNNIGISLLGKKSPVQLKLQFLSDTDNELTRLSLAEILPPEISLVASISSSLKAISPSC